MREETINAQMRVRFYFIHKRHCIFRTNTDTVHARVDSNTAVHDGIVASGAFFQRFQIRRFANGRTGMTLDDQIIGLRQGNAQQINRQGNAGRTER